MHVRSRRPRSALDGHVALITGGAKGLGQFMALGLAEAGATTVICSRNQGDCDAVAADMRTNDA